MQSDTLAAPLCLRMRNDVDPSPPYRRSTPKWPCQMSPRCAHLVNFINMDLSVCSSRSRHRGNAVRVQGCCDRVEDLADWLRNVVSQIAHGVLERVAQVLHGLHHLGCTCGLTLCNWLYSWMQSRLLSLPIISSLNICMRQMTLHKLQAGMVPMSSFQAPLPKLHITAGHRLCKQDKCIVLIGYRRLSTVMHHSWCAGQSAKKMCSRHCSAVTT